MSEQLINKFESVILKYIWKDSSPKIPLSVLQLAKDCGGLCLVDLGAKQMALKLQWIFRIMDSDFFKEVAINNLIPSLGLYIRRCNLKATDVHKLMVQSFWSEVLVA